MTTIKLIVLITISYFSIDCFSQHDAFKTQLSYLNYRMNGTEFDAQDKEKSSIKNTAFYFNLNLDACQSLFFRKEASPGKFQIKDYFEAGFGVGFGKKSSTNDAPVNGRFLITAGLIMQYTTKSDLLIGLKYLPFGYDAYIGTKSDGLGFVSSNMFYPFVKYKNIMGIIGVGVLQPPFQKLNTYKRIDIEGRYYYKGEDSKKFLFLRYQNMNYTESYNGPQGTYSKSKFGNGIFSVGISL